MRMQTIFTGAALASALLLGSAAWAQQTGGAGSTTGPAAGTNVQPSTATQKEGTGSSDASGRSATSAPGAAGGAAGVEGKPGNKSGRSEKPK
jgi:uncharacterized low-complexity protein